MKIIVVGACLVDKLFTAVVTYRGWLSSANRSCCYEDEQA